MFQKHEKLFYFLHGGFSVDRSWTLSLVYFRSVDHFLSYIEHDFGTRGPYSTVTEKLEELFVFCVKLFMSGSALLGPGPWKCSETHFSTKIKIYFCFFLIISWSFKETFFWLLTKFSTFFPKKLHFEPFSVGKFLFMVKFRKIPVSGPPKSICRMIFVKKLPFRTIFVNLIFLWLSSMTHFFVS